MENKIASRLISSTRDQRFMQIRRDYKKMSLFDIHLRVAMYGRVSTDKIEQKTSIVNQEKFYTDMIEKNPNWEYMGEYIDEGITGTSTRKREDFQRMIDDAVNGKFDLIITKEISRFARNTLDSIYYTRMLLENNVAVYFQNDNINTLDDDSELRLTIMSGIAQEEITKLSKRIKFGHRQSIKNGRVLGNSAMYGYVKKDCKLVIVPEEAEMVQYIFESYANDNTSTSKIEQELYEKGYRNRKGGRIDAGVIKNIITNPKYKGYYCGGKVEVMDVFSKRQYFRPEEEWMLWKDETGEVVPAIVNEELWDKANTIYKARGDAIKSRRHSYKTANVFTGKLYCEEHQVPFWMKQHKIRAQEPNPTWVCSHKIKNGKDSCDTVSVKENELIEMIADIANEMASNSTTIVDTYIKLLTDATNNVDTSKITTYEAKINELNAKKEKILEFNLNGHITDDEFIKRNNAYNEEIDTIKKKLKKLNDAPERDIVKDAGKLRSIIERFAHINGEDIQSPDVINAMFDKIYVKAANTDNESTVNVQIRFVFNSGEEIYKTTTKKQKNKTGKTKVSCSGHTSLTI